MAATRFQTTEMIDPFKVKSIRHGEREEGRTIMPVPPGSRCAQTLPGAIGTGQRSSRGMALSATRATAASLVSSRKVKLSCRYSSTSVAEWPR